MDDLTSLDVEREKGHHKLHQPSKQLLMLHHWGVERCHGAVQHNLFTGIAMHMWGQSRNPAEVKARHAMDRQVQRVLGWWQGCGDQF